MRILQWKIKWQYQSFKYTTNRHRMYMRDTAPGIRSVHGELENASLFGYRGYVQLQRWGCRLTSFRGNSAKAWHGLSGSFRTLKTIGLRCINTRDERSNRHLLATALQYWLFERLLDHVQLTSTTLNHTCDGYWALERATLGGEERREQHNGDDTEEETACWLDRMDTE